MGDIKTVGSRAEVMHGNAKRTSGGLRKKDLKYNKKTGKIVSVKASKLAKKRGTLKKWAKENNLVQKKGEFGWIEKK